MLICKPRNPVAWSSCDSTESHL